MGSLAIKIVIAGRTYPLTIDVDEEENLRQAARNIEDSIAFFQENYAVKDKQDLLAMTALQIATQLIVREKQPSLDSETEQLKEIDKTLSAYLEANNL